MPSGQTAKSAVKKAIKHAVGLPGGVAARFRRRDDSRILTYHSVGNRDHEMNVTPEAFAAQMEWLAANRDVVSLADAAEGCPGVAITFDDGYRDNLTNAAPVLARLGLPATVFMVTGRAGGLLAHDHDPTTSGIMTWDEVRELAGMGVDIGAHTVNHVRLSHLDGTGQRAEIAGSYDAIADALGAPPTSFAYPFGTAADYDATSIRLVRDCGFTCAVSNRYGVSLPGADPWTLRRIWIDATDSLSLFKAKVTGALDGLAILDSPLGVRARRLLNGILGTR
ncbi:MAG: polysaccharide deacetylase family protein [bacterium]|nr:polysaccharide deacetylase family protein [bacterium]